MNWKQIIDPFLQEVSCLTKLQASWNLLEHPGNAEERDFQPGFWWKSKCRIQLLVVLAAFFHGMKWSPADTAAHEKHVSRKQHLAPYMLNISFHARYSVWSSLSNSQQLTVFRRTLSNTSPTWHQIWERMTQRHQDFGCDPLHMDWQTGF